jgi:hypothetical protein
MRAWIELPPDSGWGRVRVVQGALHRLGYATDEIRGTGNVLIRLSGERLRAAELLRGPGEG